MQAVLPNLRSCVALRCGCCRCVAGFSFASTPAAGSAGAAAAGAAPTLSLFAPPAGGAPAPATSEAAAASAAPAASAPTTGELAVAPASAAATTTAVQPQVRMPTVFTCSNKQWVFAQATGVCVRVTALPESLSMLQRQLLRADGMPDASSRCTGLAPFTSCNTTWSGCRVTHYLDRVQAPSEIRGKNVEAIIAGWTAELEARSAAFVKHAAQLAEWDRHILTNRRALLDLEDELQRVRADLKHSLFGVFARFIMFMLWQSTLLFGHDLRQRYLVSTKYKYEALRGPLDLDEVQWVRRRDANGWPQEASSHLQHWQRLPLRPLTSPLILIRIWHAACVKNARCCMAVLGLPHMTT